ncbi:exodeoxyribonuclease VII large subunit [Jeotgalibacillus malaysiensis]|uniref:Exodeoxyribonuclease 7 large subunit n=1 Tax=Jeotgalibacillus malaysiensis TaxID=1508404 RepID=A0A0B5ATT0_9BACL|nr:exodeoxyribonuclease VII large subunit [Jeotgalibacillus malaysiensis]AJD91414.1 exodeoxyribonuclease VII large subunit [Jeotgalibacillus malaysiensis]
MSTLRYLTVSALTKYIKRKFDADPHLSGVLIKGEISNLKQPSSGHVYFTLKDQKTRISAVMFSSAAGSLKFKPENGMEVMLQADVSVFESSGQYQLYVKKMEPDGIGALYLAYEQLKEKLQNEGLFDQSKKRSLPPYPEHIGVITSPSGAVIKDIMTTAQRRYPIASIRLYPCSVQGENAVPSIIKALQTASEDSSLDLLIIGRGGGSIEELWAFNDEQVARAIASFPVPVISAVGHETDVTIADFAADLRAPTPTAAAEIAVPHIEEVRERIMSLQIRAGRAVTQQLQYKKQQLKKQADSIVFRRPGKLIEPHAQLLDRLNERLYRESAMIVQKAEIKRERIHERLIRLNPGSQIERKKNSLERLIDRLENTAAKKVNSDRQRFIQAAASLEALSPLKIMNRGYSLVFNESNELIKSSNQVKNGDKIKVSLQTADLICSVEEKLERDQNGEN